MMRNDIDPVEFIEQYFGIELMECQKIMLRNTLNQKEVHICYPRHCGYSEYVVYPKTEYKEDTNNDGNN